MNVDFDEAYVRYTAASAAEILRDVGWCQGDLVDRHGCCCAIGALGVASNVPIDRLVGQTDPDLVVDYSPSAKIARMRAERLVGDELGHWNDVAIRTVDEVIAVLERVADGEGAP